MLGKYIDCFKQEWIHLNKCLVCTKSRIEFVGIINRENSNELNHKENIVH